MAFVDFAAIKARISIAEAVQLLGLKMTGTNQLRGPCPACQSGGDRALVVTPEKGAAYCFAARKGGDVLWLTSHVRSEPVKDAAAFLAGNNTSPPGTVPQEREERTKPGEGFQPLQYLQTAGEALRGLEIAETTLQHYGAGYAPKGVLRGFLALPLHSADGVLRGYVGRNLTDEGSALKFPNGVEPERYLFGTVRVAEELYLTRDPLDVLKMHEAGIEGAVCFLTETISVEQLTSLMALMDAKGIETIEIL